MIISDNNFKITVKVDRDFLNILKENNIYTTRTGMNPKIRGGYVDRWKEGDVIYVCKESLIESYSTIACGANLFSCGSFSSIASQLPLNTVVGRYASIGSNCTNVGFRHPVESVSISSAAFNFSRENIAGYFDLVEKRDGYRPAPPPVSTPQPQLAPIIIGNDVWIGSGVTISGGVSIGHGAIIASNTLVTKSVGPYEIVAGIPAKFKRFRFPSEIVDGLVETRWWDFELSDLYKLGFSSPETFLSSFAKNKANIRPSQLSQIKLADFLS